MQFSDLLEETQTLQLEQSNGFALPVLGTRVFAASQRPD